MDTNHISTSNNILQGTIQNHWWTRLKMVAELANDYDIAASRIRVFNDGDLGEVRISVDSIDGDELPEEFVRDSEFLLDGSFFYGIFMDSDTDGEGISLLTGSPIR